MSRWKTIPRPWSDWDRWDESDHASDPRNYNAWRGLEKQVICLDPCVYCGQVADPTNTIDHIVPQARATRRDRIGGNIAAACLGCNGKKDNEKMLLFLLWRRFL